MFLMRLQGPALLHWTTVSRLAPTVDRVLTLAAPSLGQNILVLFVETLKRVVSSVRLASSQVGLFQIIFLRINWTNPRAAAPRPRCSAASLVNQKPCFCRTGLLASFSRLPRVKDVGSCLWVSVCGLHLLEELLEVSKHRAVYLDSLFLLFSLFQPHVVDLSSCLVCFLCMNQQSKSLMPTEQYIFYNFLERWVDEPNTVFIEHIFTSLSFVFIVFKTKQRRYVYTKKNNSSVTVSGWKSRLEIWTENLTRSKRDESHDSSPKISKG